MYWLHEPDAYRPIHENDRPRKQRRRRNESTNPPYTERGPSQKDIHLDARAQLAVLSNLMDLFLPLKAVRMMKKW